MDLNELNEGLQAEASKIEAETVAELNETINEYSGITAEDLLLNDMTIIKNKLDILNAQIEHQNVILKTNKKFSIFILVVVILILLVCIYNLLMNMDILNAINIINKFIQN